MRVVGRRLVPAGDEYIENGLEEGRVDTVESVVATEDGVRVWRAP